MTNRLDALLDWAGRPLSVTWAALLSVTAGTGTLVASVVVIWAVFGHVGADWFLAVAQLVAVTQVVAATLLIVGGLRLAMGDGRTVLVVGATLHLLVCGAYVLYARTEVAGDTTEGPTTAAIFTAMPFVFAALPAVSLFLVLYRNRGAGSGVEGV